MVGNCKVEIGESYLKGTGAIDIAQDFLIKLGIKPSMHLMEISIFLLSKSCHRQTYQNYELSRQKLDVFLENKVHFKNQSFQKI